METEMPDQYDASANLSHRLSTPSEISAAPVNRRNVLKLAGVAAAAINVGSAAAQTASPTAPAPQGQAEPTKFDQRMIGYTLSHEQFPVNELVEIAAAAGSAGFSFMSTSDHIQPWQANEGHAGQAWVTLGAAGARSGAAWMGTMVTCPTLRYHPAVVAEGFASLSLLYPGRIFLGVGSGEALNEQAATGQWPAWRERWDRLIEAIGIIRELWTGREVHHKGKFYTVDAKLYDPPPKPIPLLTAANAKKSMRLAGIHGDGLITDPQTWKQYKSEWEAGAREAGKNPANMQVMVEQFVATVDPADARDGAELWRFLPKAFKGYENIPDPAKIQQEADSQIPLEKVMSDWAIGPDPEIHIKKINELLASGVTKVNIHSAQPDQKKVIEFYRDNVLPKVNRA
jgi:TAT-translocated FGD2 family F420-dependent dehydrogenase